MPQKSRSELYGSRHQRLRRQWKPHVDAGEVCCARCGRRIEPGSPWDLGHSDFDVSVYTGPEHRRCNRQVYKNLLENVAHVGGPVRRFSQRW